MFQVGSDHAYSTICAGTAAVGCTSVMVPAVAIHRQLVSKERF
jgi:hypothetical protein